MISSYAQEKNKYDITLVTGSHDHAGTSDVVILEIFGEKASSGDIFLSNDRNELLRGSTQNFSKTMEDLGKLSEILIRIEDNDGNRVDGWKGERINIRDSNRDTIWGADLGFWLDDAQKENHSIAKQIKLAFVSGPAPITVLCSLKSGLTRQASLKEIWKLSIQLRYLKFS